MIYDIKIDLRTFLHIAQVGSSIYGKLLKPNDIDIVICFKLPFLCFIKAKTFKIKKLNIILIHGLTLHDYVAEFDMGIIKGYKSVFTRKLHLSQKAKHDFKYKIITQYARFSEIWGSVDYDKDDMIARAKLYMSKLPKNWKFIPHESIEKKLKLK